MQSHTIVCESPRLRIRYMAPSDAEFIAQLLTEPAWLRFIGDRGVRNVEDANGYIEAKRREYATMGYGMYVVESKATSQALGLCGLVKREWLSHPDLGFALAKRYWGHGYAIEAAAAVAEFARTTLALPQLLAVATPDNERSHRLLLKLGFQIEEEAYTSPEGDALRLYKLDA